MSYYTVKIIKNKQTLLLLAANDTICDDNFLWWKLGELVDLCQKGELSIKTISQKTEVFFEIKDNDQFECDVVVDLDNQTITKPFFPIYSFDEVNPETCCISLVKKGDKFYSKYDDGSEYEMKHVSFDCEDLLHKKIVSFSDFKKISEFVISITEGNETDFVLNNHCVIRFNIL